MHSFTHFDKYVQTRLQVPPDAIKEGIRGVSGLDRWQTVFVIKMIFPPPSWLTNRGVLFREYRVSKTPTFLLIQMESFSLNGNSHLIFWQAQIQSRCFDQQNNVLKHVGVYRRHICLRAAASPRVKQFTCLYLVEVSPRMLAAHFREHFITII